MPYWQPTMNQFRSVSGSGSVQLLWIRPFRIIILVKYLFTYFSSPLLSFSLDHTPANTWHTCGKVPCTSNPQSVALLSIQYVQNALFQGVEWCLILQLLLLLTGSIRLMVLCFYTGFGVFSYFGFSWLFFLDYFRPLYTGFLRLLFLNSFIG